MEILGLNKTTLLDYPGHVAATVFTGGCNFRCPFCHNGDLVLHPGTQPGVPEEEVFALLERRRGILEGVCITGGEPTLQPDLPEFIREIKGLGYLVKLDTNGYRPKILRRLLEEGLTDYVAMDIKASPEAYARAAGCHELDFTRIQESISLLMGCGIPCEFRTTVVQGLHTVEEFDAIGALLKGAGAYYLQAFRENEHVIQKGFQAFPAETMEEIREKVKKYIDRVELRGV